MGTLSNNSKVGDKGKDLILQTSGRVYVQVKDRFYEINFRGEDEEDKEELLENLTCWTYDIWVVRYLVSLPNQTKLNYTQLEMCLLLLEEIQEVPCLLHGEFRFEKSETDFLNDISFINNFNINEGVYYIDSLEITNYLIKKIKITMPSDDVVQAFEKQVDDIYGNIRMLLLINKNLAEQRDMLLPRLMSGKLEV